MSTVRHGNGFKDLTGQVFGRLTVLKYHDTVKKKPRWKCRCECGSIKIIIGRHMVQGRANSCGCLHREQLAERNWKHGQAYTREFGIWQGIRNRCSTHLPEAITKNYGRRGIKVCERWQNSFEAFLEDMGPRPSPRHTIERKDVNGDYCPENCCWATRKEQSRNKRNNHMLTLNGETKTAAGWAEQLGVKPYIIYDRIALGWDDERILTTPIRPRCGPRPKG